MCRDIASCKRHLRGISHGRHSLRLLAAADDVFDEPAMSPIGPTRRSCLSAYGGFRSKQTQKLFGRPPRPAGSRSISRTSDRTTEPASGLGPFGSRSLRQEFGGIRYARFHDANKRVTCGTIRLSRRRARQSDRQYHGNGGHDPRLDDGPDDRICWPPSQRRFRPAAPYAARC